jgi:uncharacterized peroxidase-related enzyme
MNQMNLVSPESAPENVTVTYKLVHRNLGRVPNMYQVMANSPAVLNAYVAFQGALAGGMLNRQMAERIALATAEKNGCAYCLSAHDFFGRKIGLTSEDIADARSLQSNDKKVHEVLTFVRKMLEMPHVLTQDDLTTLRKVGFSDAEVLEIIAHVVRNLFTNYVNIIAGTTVDWPTIVQPNNAETK